MYHTAFDLPHQANPILSTLENSTFAHGGGFDEPAPPA
jgi:hypothetical protein